MIETRRDMLALVDQGVASAGAFGVTMVFIRGAGLEEFGVLSLVWLVLLFASGLQHAVLVAPAQALFPKVEDLKGSSFRGWLLCVHFVFVALLLGVLWASWVAPWFSFLPASTGFLAPALFLASRLTFTFFRRQLFISEEGPKWALPVDSLHALIAIVGLSALAYSGVLDSRTGLLVLAGASACGTIAAIPSFRSLGCSLGAVDKALLLRHWGISRWLTGKAVAQWFTSNAFLVALGTIHGPAALGGVRAAQTLVGLAGTVIQSFENVVPVAAARAFDGGGGVELCQFMRASTWRWFAWLIGLLLPVVAFPGLFLAILSGRSGLELHQPLYFFAVGSLLALAIGCCQVCLRATERVSPVFWAQVAAGSVGGLLAVPVTAGFGMTGCLIGIICQQMIVLGVLLRPTQAALRSNQGPSARTPV